MRRLRHPVTGVVVRVGDDTASRLGWPDAAQPSPTAEEVHVCGMCGFEAKTAAGLGAHARSHEEG